MSTFRGAHRSTRTSRWFAAAAVFAAGAVGSFASTAASPASAATLFATTTSLSCTPLSGATTTCTVTVTNAATAPASATGSVAFTTSSTGSFGASSCTLESTGPHSSTCTAGYTTGGSANTIDTLTASYGGDALDASSTGSLGVTVQQQPAVTTASLPNGEIGIPYVTTTLSASGGTGSYSSWSLTGSLPPGLSLDASSGTISGTPSSTDSGTYGSSVTVTDSDGSASPSASLSIVIRVNPVVTTSSLPGAEQSVLYSPATLGASGGSGGYQDWTTVSGSLPPGLELDPSSGTVTGVPSASDIGTYSFSVTVTDANGLVSSAKAVSIAVSAISAIATSSAETVNTFAYTGAVQQFTVPAGVTTVTISSYGARGGGGPGWDSPESVGGYGGYAQATVPVIPGQLLSVDVGGVGSTGVTNSGVPSTGGFGGGAAGGPGMFPTDPSYGGGGGGASSVLSDTTPLVVAAGGGGGGTTGDDPNETGGNGGAGGQNGSEGGYASPDGSDGLPGGGATSTAGGAGGGIQGTPEPGETNGGDGSSLQGGQGGAGGTDDGYQAGGGGGGGGGYFGGGGGGGGTDESGGGGGGGSSYAIPSATGATYSSGAESGAGSVVIGYSSSSGPQTVTVGYSGAAQSFTVPAGVTSIQATAEGAQGGSAPNWSGETSTGGLGAKAIATIPVSAGELLTVTVGGAGEGHGLSSGIETLGGLGGGGDGGSGMFPTGASYGGGGGGASSVFSGSTPLVVAAGGGGAGTGFDDPGQVGGNGGSGGYVGGAGTNPTLTGDDGTPGGGGSQSGGGFGGIIGGTSGTFLLGGNGGDGANQDGYVGAGGGGGGGGYYGGGGSGGGQDITADSAGGGGGSSYTATTGTFVSGAQSGNGAVSLTYTVADSTPPVVTVAAPSVVTTTGSSAAVDFSALAVDPSGTPGTSTPVCTADGNPFSSGGSLSLGTHTITCTADNSVGIQGTGSASVDIVEAIQVTSTASAVMTVGAPGSFTVTTSASPTASISDGGAGLPAGVTFKDNGDGTATLAGTPQSAGTYPLTLTASNGVAPAASQSFTLTVAAPSSVVIASSPPDPAVVGETYAPVAAGPGTATVAITVATSASSVCRVTKGVVHLDASGTCTVDAHQGASKGQAASSASQSFAVGAGPQAVTITSTPKSPTYGGHYVVVAKPGASSQPVAFSVDPSTTAVCSIVALPTATRATVELTGSGSCTIDANEEGNANYTAAPTVHQTVSVAPAAQHLRFAGDPAHPAVGGTYVPKVVGDTSGAPVVLAVGDASSALCQVEGDGRTIAFTAVGSCVVEGSVAATADYAAASAALAITVAQGAQKIAFTSVPPVPAAAGDTYALAASGGGSGNPVTFSIAAASATVCSLGDDGHTVSLLAKGSCRIQADQAGSAGYLAAPQVKQTVAVKAG